MSRPGTLFFVAAIMATAVYAFPAGAQNANERVLEELRRRLDMLQQQSDTEKTKTAEVAPPERRIAAGPPPGSSPALAACVADLKTLGGGWCQLKGSKISDVYPPNLPRYIRGIEGPDSLVTAWSGAAWDYRRRRMYFTGGGHSNYGGNEVYEYDVSSGKFSRLTDPGEYPYKEDPTNCKSMPIKGPPSRHTYDGFVYSGATDTLFMMPSSSTYCWPGGRRASINYNIWEFNPDRHASRNSLAPLTWRMKALRPEGFSSDGAYLRADEMPDGTFYVAAMYQRVTYNPKTDRWTGVSGWTGHTGWGTMTYDPVRQVLWEAISGGFYVTNAFTKRIRRLSRLPSGFGAGSGVAVTPTGEIYLWGGDRAVARYEVANNAWNVWETAKGPVYRGVASVLSKWVWLDFEGVAMGMSYPKDGMWVWLPPKTGWHTVPSTRR